MIRGVEVLSLLILDQTTTALSEKITKHVEEESDLVLYFAELKKALETQQHELWTASEVWAARSINYRHYQNGFLLGFDAITTQLPEINLRYKVTFQDLVEAGFNGEITQLMARSLSKQGRSYDPTRLKSRPVNPGQSSEAFIKYLIEDSSEFFGLVNSLSNQLGTTETIAFTSGLHDSLKAYIAKIRDEIAYQACIKSRRLL